MRRVDRGKLDSVPFTSAYLNYYIDIGIDSVPFGGAYLNYHMTTHDHKLSSQAIL